MEKRFSKISKKNADEISFLTKLDHPNIVKIFSVEPISEGGSLIAMEDVKGMSLLAFTDEHGLLSASETAYIGIRLCRAVGYLHSLTPPWLYCDMKPENIIVTGGLDKIKDVILIDIDGGIAMILDGLPPEKSFGTKDFAAPEQKDLKAPLDYRVDVYGICATLKAVFDGGHLIKSSRERRLLGIIKKGTDKDPKQRYFTVKELENELMMV